MKIDKERKRFLKQELKEYEKTTPLTEEEMSALREWVKAGTACMRMGLPPVMKAAGRWISWMFTGRKKRSGRPLLP